MRSYLHLFTTFVFILGGCADSGNQSADSGNQSADGGNQSKGTIGFSALTLKNPFFKVIADSLTEEAQKHGFEVILNDADRDVNTQSKHIDNYIAQNVTAIVLNPADRTAIGPAIKKANAAGTA